MYKRLSSNINAQRSNYVLLVYKCMHQVCDDWKLSCNIWAERWLFPTLLYCHLVFRRQNLQRFINILCEQSILLYFIFLGRCRAPAEERRKYLFLFCCAYWARLWTTKICNCYISSLGFLKSWVQTHLVFHSSIACKVWGRKGL